MCSHVGGLRCGCRWTDGRSKITLILGGVDDKTRAPRERLVIASCPRFVVMAGVRSAELTDGPAAGPAAAICGLPLL